MKWYDELVATNLLWAKPGARFWWRQTAVGPVAIGVISSIEHYEYLPPQLLCYLDESVDPGNGRFPHIFTMGIHEINHMSTYPGEDNDDGR